MAGLQTGGFALSQFPRSPEIPANIGELDVKGIYDRVKQGLETFEAVRRAPAGMALADQQMALDTQKAVAGQQTLPSETAANIIKNRGVLADTPVRSGILSDQGQVSTATVPLTLAELREKQQHLAEQQAIADQGKVEMPAARTEIASALSEPDATTRAAKLSSARLKYPWLGHPDYKDLAGITDTAQKLAETAAQKEADQAAAAARAKIIAEGGIERAKVTIAGRAIAPEKEFEQESATFDKYRTMALEADNPDDAEMYAQRAARAKQRMDALTVDKVNMATAANTSRERIGEAKNTTTLQNTREKAKAVMAAAEGQARSAVIESQRQSDQLGTLIDDSIDRATLLTASFPGHFISKLSGTEAKDLKQQLSTITGNIAIQTLNAMRQASKSGGAMGNVSDADISLLKGVLGSLESDQTVEQLKGNLEAVKVKLDQLRKIQTDAYEHRFGTGHTPDYQQIVGAAGATPAANAAPVAPQYEVGKVYTDAKGNKATYRGPGQWEDIH